MVLVTENVQKQWPSGYWLLEQLVVMCQFLKSEIQRVKYTENSCIWISVHAAAISTSGYTLQKCYSNGSSVFDDLLILSDYEVMGMMNIFFIWLGFIFVILWCSVQYFNQNIHILGAKICKDRKKAWCWNLNMTYIDLAVVPQMYGWRAYTLLKNVQVWKQ